MSTISYNQVNFGNGEPLKYGVFFYTMQDELLPDISYYTDNLTTAREIENQALINSTNLKIKLYCEVYTKELNKNFGLENECILSTY